MELERNRVSVRWSTAHRWMFKRENLSGIFRKSTLNSLSVHKCQMVHLKWTIRFSVGNFEPSGHIRHLVTQFFECQTIGLRALEFSAWTILLQRKRFFARLSTRLSTRLSKWCTQWIPLAHPHSQTHQIVYQEWPMPANRFHRLVDVHLAVLHNLLDCQVRRTVNTSPAATVTMNYWGKKRSKLMIIYSQSASKVNCPYSVLL